jgi:hypothetical protein
LVFYPDRFRVRESLRVLTHDGRNIFYSNAGHRWDGRDCSRILDTEIVVGSSTVPGDTRISVRAR